MFTDFRLILTLLSNQERARFWVLVCLTFFVSVVEALTVVSILPFLEVISDPEAINEKDFLSFLFSFFDFDSVNRFVVFLGFLVFAVTVFGLLLKMLSIWLTTRFALMRSFNIGSRLFNSFLHKTYIELLGRNSSTINSDVKLSERNQVTFASNRKYFESKVNAGRFDEGRWDLQIRRVNSWD